MKNNPFCFEESKWNEILAGFSDASVYQSWAYGVVRWGENCLSHLILEEDGIVLCAAQVILKKIPFSKYGIAYIPWGPMWKRKNRNPDIKYLHRFLQKLKNEYAIKRGLLLRIAPNCIKEENDQIKNIYHDLGFSFSKKNNKYRSILMDLSPSLEQIRKKLDQKWRNQLNKAEKLGIVVEEGTSLEMYDVFLNLQKDMQARKRYIPQIDYNQFKKIQEKLPNDLKFKIYIGKNENKPICAVIVSAIGDTAIYLLGATATDGMRLNGSNLLQWKSIEWLKSLGIENYDLGGIDPDENPGVYNFKLNLAGKNGKEIYHVEPLEFCDSKLLNSVNIIEHLLEKLNKCKKRLKLKKR